jgi:hypothetical protein
VLFGVRGFMRNAIVEGTRNTLHHRHPLVNPTENSSKLAIWCLEAMLDMRVRLAIAAT